jgi:hypothetical protein
LRGRLYGISHRLLVQFASDHRPQPLWPSPEERKLPEHYTVLANQVCVLLFHTFAKDPGEAATDFWPGSIFSMIEGVDQLSFRPVFG